MRGHLSLRMVGNLWAPVEFWVAPAAVRGNYTNGCGPGGWIVDLVPDVIYGISITEACDIHDWMYHFGVSERDRRIADGLFYRNIVGLIDNSGGYDFLLRLRRRAARKYYDAVHVMGAKWFWRGKHENG